jgi:dissimilatory sulfite reductase (desulfoviridin) alpha/beta subunit
MRCVICNKDCPDGEIKLEKKGGKIVFSPCLECTNLIQLAILDKELEEKDEETPTMPLWDFE